ncbi:hypothetical protein N2152v2_005092 [Parachlorella kessleri]
MDIIIHSLYSNKDIFLRELISNAADALDKIRFLSLTDKSQLGEGENQDLEIRISIDKNNSMITIRDRGIGMTKQDLIQNLGTIAKSGTSAFLEQMQKGGDLNLIGQFGVGFYSVYLVADYVEVITKHNDDTQYIWESGASGSFAISEDKEGDPLGRGTKINIYLKETVHEYLQQDKLKELVQRYSEFISFPIYLLTEKTVEKEVPLKDEEAAETPAKPADEEEEAEEKEEAQKGDEIEVEEEEEEEKADEKPKTKKVSESVTEWELLNDNKALWLRNPSDVAEEEHTKFYKALAKNENDEPLAHTHFKAEGDVEFRAILYVPGTAPFDFYDNYYSKKPRVKLYVRRVFISEDFEDLLPRWLSFLVGLVDSDTMPLNVSREMLQLHEGLKVIKKKLVRKALDVIRKLSDAEIRGREQEEKEQEEEHKKDLEKAAKQAQGEAGETKGDSAAAATDAGKGAEADDEPARAATTKDDSGDDGTDKSDDDDEEEEEGGESASSDDDKKAREEDIKKYDKFWSAFGKAIKMGIIEDASNRRRLMPLLRFHTSVSQHRLVSLDDYVKRMKEGQKHIYYLVGQNMDELRQSPFVESLVDRGFEVIYFMDPLDEYMMQNLLEYEDKEFSNVSKDDLKLDKDEDEKKAEKKLKEEYKPLTKWWKEQLRGDAKIDAVKLSKRLSSTPCVVLASKYGWSATMERIQRAQALGDSERAKYMRGSRTFEINPKHPLVRELKARHAADPEDEKTKDVARLLFDMCLMESGFVLDDVKGFNALVFTMLKDSLDIKDWSVDADEAGAEEEHELPLESEIAADTTGEDGSKEGSGVGAAAADATPAAGAAAEDDVAAAGHEEL